MSSENSRPVQIDFGNLESGLGRLIKRPWDATVLNETECHDSQKYIVEPRCWSYMKCQ